MSAPLPLIGPRAVLDTNVALALWLFGDARLEPLRAALRFKRVHWIATPAMLEELRHEIRPERCARYGVSGDRVWAEITEVAPTLFDLPIQAQRGGGRFSCSDPADQMFIDLALQERVDWLFSRDRAVLKLKRKARPLGVSIQPPEGWQLPSAPVSLNIGDQAP